MRRLRDAATLLAPTTEPLLIRGEAGTGKTSLAQAIHIIGKRKGRFVGANLAALERSLPARYVPNLSHGGTANARSSASRLLSEAEGGTLYLDGLESASVKLQTSLIQLLDELGSGDTHTNRGKVPGPRLVLSATVLGNTILPDLLSRLTLIDIPPLRTRREDVPLIVRNVLGTRKRISDEAMSLLINGTYRGNVSELVRAVKLAMAASKSRLIEANNIAIAPPHDDGRIKELLEDLEHLQSKITSLQSCSIVANPIWQGRTFQTDEQYCFVLMPFSDIKDLPVFYSRHLRPVIEDRCGMRCERADDIHDISGIMQSVWESLNRARIVIADMTEKNPNVFYELGIAHTLGKPVIMVTQSMEYVPFDLKHLRCIVYEFKPGKIEQFEAALEKTVRTILASSHPGEEFRVMAAPAL